MRRLDGGLGAELLNVRTDDLDFRGPKADQYASEANKEEFLIHFLDTSF